MAAEFPGVKFEHAGGYKTAPNLNTYNARYDEGRYLAGLVAGAVSGSGVAGHVAGFPVPEVIQGINAFTLGMRAANPKAQVRVLWLNTWFDPAREREARRWCKAGRPRSSPALSPLRRGHRRGNGRQAAGVMSDDAIAKMDYFVQGVIGSVPK